MESSVTSALAITVVGMTLLFLTLVFFYGLMVLITALLKDPQAVPEGSARDVGPEAGEHEAMLRAAAIAVAMARAEAELGAGPRAVPTVGEGDGPVSTSPWWTFYHQRRLRPDSNPRRVL